MAVEATGLLMQSRMNSTLVPADRTATSALAQTDTARKLAPPPKLAAAVLSPRPLTASLVTPVANTLAEPTLELRSYSHQEQMMMIGFRRDRDRWEHPGASEYSVRADRIENLLKQT